MLVFVLLFCVSIKPKSKGKKKDTTKPSKKTKIFFFLEGEEKRLKFNEIFEQHKKKNLERKFKALSKKKIFFFFTTTFAKKKFPSVKRKKERRKGKTKKNFVFFFEEKEN